MKILIAGLGSIGAEIAFTFYSSADITCIDHGKHFETIRKTLPKITFVKGDIHDSSLLNNIPEQLDVVFYCIDTGSVISCIENPEKYKKINTALFRQFLENLYKKHNPHFFLLSSSFVYPDIDNITEQTNPYPATLYGEFRLKQEKILQEYSSDYTILRLSNIFGYGHFFNIGSKGAIEKFIDCVFSHKKISLHGNGKQLVDYLSKSDLMMVLKTLIKKNPKTIYNVSSGSSKSIADVAQIISSLGLEKFNKKSDISIMSNESLPNSPKIFPTKISYDYNLSFNHDIESSIFKMMNIRSKKLID